MKDTSLLIAAVISVSTLAGALLGAWLYSRGSRRQEILTELKAEHQKACEQIKSYYNLEALYADAISKKSGTPIDSIKAEFRTKVEKSESFVRPTWTMRQAQDSIDRFC